MNKVLMISYYWPPAGGPGVQRPLKFARYLPHFGWQPIVLTVKDGVYPATDRSLAEEVPAELPVYRSRNPEPDALYRRFAGRGSGETAVGVLAQKNLSWKQRLAHSIRMNWFIPDAKKFWLPFALSTAEKIIREHRPAVVWSTSPPPTSHLIAMKLAQKHGLKWVADFRDPWSRIHYYGEQRSRRARQKDRALEREVLQRCDRAVCVSQKFAGLLEKPEDKNIHILPNGFDGPDFENKTSPDKDYFDLAYVGGLNENRYYPHFFRALAGWINAEDERKRKVRLTLAGKVAPHIHADIENIFGGWSGLRFAGYVAHREALRIMSGAAVLLLFTEQTTQYEGHLPGKLFEYLAAQRPIMALSPFAGEAAEILDETESGRLFSKSDDALDWLRNLYGRWQNGDNLTPPAKAIDRYERKTLTGELARIFNELVV